MDPGSENRKDTLLAIVRGTAGATGEGFFDQLVKQLATATGIRCAWVTEWLPESRRLRALSFWVGDGYYGDYEYDVAGTPCEAVIESRERFCVPDRVIELFPDDPDLAPLSAVSYLGQPLVDTDGSVLGHLALMHTEPLRDDPEVTAIFDIFAARAGAELARVRRDRDLRDREEKLSRLFDNAMDAIVELDADLQVTQTNTAAVELFGRPPDEVVGCGLSDLLAEDSAVRVEEVTRELERESRDRAALWIGGLLAVCRPDGSAVEAEATVSRVERDRVPHYTLIIRNVADRLAAEERIRVLTDEARYLRQELDSLQGFDEILGASEVLRELLVQVDQVAQTDATVLIHGETGTGKELVARAVHERSGRADHPIVKVNCAAISANLQESEFFGHERGAFTGAVTKRDGRFKLADGGTIFLDEVGELPPDLQAKLLRVLQEGEFEPVGGTRTLRVDVRVISATNRDLEEMVEAGTFRRDLLYRLNVFPLAVPALRERGEDVLLLAQAFAQRLARRHGRSGVRLTPDGQARLLRYDWPGNVRELHNIVERALITSRDGEPLRLDRALPASDESAPGPVVEPTDERVLTATEMRDLERANMIRALDEAGWKISGAGGAAERLGLNANTLSSRMRALRIRKPA